MNEWLPIVVSVIALIATTYFNVSAKKRTEQHDAKKDGSELTTVIVKLEYISSGVSEIKNDVKNLKNDIQENRERIVRVEQSYAQVQRELDSLRSKEATKHDEH